MLKFDGKKVIYSRTLRKVIFDLIEETNYSGECQTDIEIPVKKKNFSYRRYFRF